RRLPRIAEEARGHPWQLPADGYPHHHRQNERRSDLDTHSYPGREPPSCGDALFSATRGRRKLPRPAQLTRLLHILGPAGPAHRVLVAVSQWLGLPAINCVAPSAPSSRTSRTRRSASGRYDVTDLTRCAETPRWEHPTRSPRATG